MAESPIRRRKGRAVMPQLFTKPMFIALAAALVTAAAALSVFLGIRELRQVLNDARQQTAAERDAYWHGEIAKADAAGLAKVNDALKATLAVQADASDKIAAAVRRATELEKDNAVLPDGDKCGLSRERGQLLNKR